VTVNLVQLWSYAASQHDPLLFQWRSETAGLLLMLNTPKLWQLATQINITELPDEIFNDQKILKLVALHHADRVGELPAAWGVHSAEDWRYRNSFPQQFPQQLATGHCNGGSDSSGGPFWNKSVKVELDKHEWGSIVLLLHSHALVAGAFFGRKRSLEWQRIPGCN
jgi:hypothetical protein